MNVQKKLLAIAISLSLSACGGSDSNSDSETYSITAIDGYLTNALVWLDTNGNYQLDEDEPNSYTDTTGVAHLNTTGIDNPQQYAVVVQAIQGQTIDIGEDVDNPENNVVESSYMMSAPSGETSITPFSTLVNLILEKNTTSESTEAEIAEALSAAVESVADMLGVDSEDILGDFIATNKSDIIYAAENIVSSGLLPESAEELSELIEEAKNNESTLLAATEAVTSVIKVVIESTDDTTDFSLIEAAFDTENNEETNSDSDEDGVWDSLDKFPNDSSEWLDSDADGVGNNADAFPNDATETTDSDEDGVGDNTDAFPNNATETIDSDEDGIGDNADTFPDDASESTDTDADGVGDNADAFPNDASETVDSDEDGVGDNSDAFPDNATEWLDVDGDGIGDNVDDYTTEEETNRFVAITDTTVDESGELRVHLNTTLATGAVTVKIQYPLQETNMAYLSLFGSSWSDTSDAIADLKMNSSYAETDGYVGIKLRDSDNSDDEIITEYVAGEWTDFKVSWDTDASQYTVSVNDIEIGTYDMFNTQEFNTVRFKFTNTAVKTNYSFYVDDLTIYSDTAGTIEVLSDDFEGTDIGTDLGLGDDAYYSDRGYSAIVVDPETTETDSDGDGVADYYDAFPNDADEWSDSNEDESDASNSESYEMAVGGTVTFDESYTSVPGDAMVRIVPRSDKDQGDYSTSARCDIDSQGNFGDDCYIDAGQADAVTAAMNVEGETFQVVVFKNHIDSEQNRWDCAEDLYKYVDGQATNWSNISVMSSDYQDRSGEDCSDDDSTDDSTDNSSDSGNQEFIIDATNLVLGYVSFTRDEIPDNAWIRISSDSQNEEGNYSRVTCEIQSDQSFGLSNCATSSDFDLSVFEASSQYELIVFEESNDDGHYNSDEKALCMSLWNEDYSDAKNLNLDCTYNVDSITPLTATKGQSQEYYINGYNLPASVYAYIGDGGEACSLVESDGAYMKMNCATNVAGSHEFYIYESEDGERINSDGTIYIIVSELESENQ